MIGISDSLLFPPQHDQIEITLFGPGYGEAVVCHLGGGRWMIVDSCVDRQTRLPVSASYLDAIGVECATAVSLIVATHFDDDHIRGLAHLVKLCPDACFCVSAALHADEFFEFLTASTQNEGGVRREAQHPWALW